MNNRFSEFSDQKPATNARFFKNINEAKLRDLMLRLGKYKNVRKANNTDSRLHSLS